MQTAGLAAGFGAVCPFVNDRCDAPTLESLRTGGTRLLTLRSAGHNHVDLEAADRLGLTFVRVREDNFALEGLVGFDLHGKTVGVVGTGRIGRVAAGIFRGFGCRVLAYDLAPDPALANELGLSYVTLEELYARSDIITLHVPLTPSPDAPHGGRLRAGPHPARDDAHQHRPWGPHRQPRPHPSPP